MWIDLHFLALDAWDFPWPLILLKLTLYVLMAQLVLIPAARRISTLMRDFHRP